MSRWTIKYTRVCRDVGGKGGGGWRRKRMEIWGGFLSSERFDSGRNTPLLYFVNLLGNNVGGIGVLSLRGWILQKGEILAWKFLCTSSIWFKVSRIKNWMFLGKIRKDYLNRMCCYYSIKLERILYNISMKFVTNLIFWVFFWNWVINF